jgi:hypothetical protein
VFDPDYQPEGAATQVAYSFNDQHTLRFIGAGFVLDEFNQGANATHDPFMYGGQLLWESKWSPKFESSVSVAAFGFGYRDNLLDNASPNVNDGNTRGPGTNGPPIYNFTPIIAGGSLTYKLDGVPLYKELFPIKPAGEFMYNSDAPAGSNKGWWAGVTLGKAGKKGLWEVSYKYERLESDAIYEELPDDDFGAFYQAGFPNSGNGAGYRGGTNVKGHVVKLNYNFTDHMNLAFTYYRSELIVPNPAASVSASSHFMVDLMWKF